VNADVKSADLDSASTWLKASYAGESSDVARMAELCPVGRDIDGSR